MTDSNSDTSLPTSGPGEPTARPRGDGRPDRALRPVRIQRNFTAAPAGSVLWQQGGTIVLCTASVVAKVPDWFGPQRPGGWVTADYVMLPGSTPQRKDWPRLGHTDSRGTEITRLIGRVLRAAVDLTALGPHTVSIDCTVLQADGGTRTAAICGGYLALRDALSKLPPALAPPRGDSPSPGYLASQAAYRPSAALREPVAAVSVGYVGGVLRLDLDYNDDAVAEVDLNVAMTASGRVIEVQGTAETPDHLGRVGYTRSQLQEMLDLAAEGCRQLFELQARA